MTAGRLSLAVFSGGFDRVHYALVMAAAAAATGRTVTLFLTGRAVLAVLARPGWTGLDPADDGSDPATRDAAFVALGVAGFEELLAAVVALGARVLVCEMSLRVLGIGPGPGEATPFRPDIPVEITGVVGFLGHAGATGEGPALVFI